jgi:hypothetical protein
MRVFRALLRQRPVNPGLPAKVHSRPARAKPALSFGMSELGNSLTINGRLPKAARICVGSTDAVFDRFPVTGFRNRWE